MGWRMCTGVATTMAFIILLPGVRLVHPIIGNSVHFQSSFLWSCSYRYILKQFLKRADLFVFSPELIDQVSESTSDEEGA